MFHTKTKVTIIDTSPAAAGPAAYGREKFLSTLKNLGCQVDIVDRLNQETHGIRIVVGLTDTPFIRSILGNIAAAPEGVVLKSFGPQNMLVISGTDERGLMYALLEMAQHLEDEGLSGFDTVRDVTEFPANRVRGVDRYVMGHLDNEWFFSDAFWQYFISRLAENRFNRFVLILGFDTAYLTPPYPFFVNVPGFRDVRAVAEQKQKENLTQLRHIGRICHNSGVDFFLGTWQQLPWTEVQKHLVENLPSDEGALAEYCARGMTTLLNACDTVDGVQLRVNFEAGVGSQVSNDTFWMRIVDAVAEVSRPLTLAIRAKGMSDNLLAYARASGLKFEVPTKHWCEHTGLPYHLSRMRTEELTQLDNLNHSRRYSYADMLRKPKKSDIIYRLWNYGSTCLFTWGDPDSARRFSQSCLMGGSGFEIDAALSLKYGQERLQKKSWSIYSEPGMPSPAWEDERHWLRYLLYGRLGYAPDTSAKVWQRELEKRFGIQAAPLLERAYAAAGKVMPLITAAHMPVHPSLIYWPEMSTGAALFGEHNVNTRYGQVTYGSTEPSDPGLFYGIDEYVADLNAHRLKGKYTPLQAAGWFRYISDEINGCLSHLDAVRSIQQNLEYRQAVIDLRMNAEFARYHAWKISAAYHLAQYTAGGGLLHLQMSHVCMATAAEVWRELAHTGAVFHNNLEFGVGAPTDRHGHWRDRIKEMDQDLARLSAMLEVHPGASLEADKLARLKKQAEGEVPGRWILTPDFTAEWPQTCTAGDNLEISVAVNGVMNNPSPLLHYRHTNQLEGEFNMVEMLPYDGGYRAVIPGAYIDYAWDLLVYVTRVDSDRHVTIFPGIYHPLYPAPYHWIVVS
jgi:hypothetical protein